MKRIVMADRRGAAEQISDPAPPEPYIQRNLAMACYLLCMRNMYLPSPLLRIAICGGVCRASKSGIEAKLKMIVRVDKAGEQKISRYVDCGSRNRAGTRG